MDKVVIFLRNCSKYILLKKKCCIFFTIFRKECTNSIYSLLQELIQFSRQSTFHFASWKPLSYKEDLLIMQPSFPLLQSLFLNIIIIFFCIYVLTTGYKTKNTFRISSFLVEVVITHHMLKPYQMIHSLVPFQLCFRQWHETDTQSFQPTY